MLPTKESRSVLPSTYALSQFVPNIGRFAALTHLLCRKDLSDVSNAALVKYCFMDGIHTEYRAKLVSHLS